MYLQLGGGSSTRAHRLLFGLLVCSIAQLPAKCKGNLWPRRDVDAFLSERGLEYHQIQKKLREAGDQITLRLLEIHNEDEREAWLEKTMEEEKRAKLLDLIGRIMSTVGTITDAAALYIGPEGDINGIIVGTEGKAKIQTIGAGGYNIQCFHFRTLIHEIK